MSIIKIRKNLGIPLYKQIVSSIEDSLVEGIIKKGDRLPSINSIRNRNELSRDTVLLAYNELKVRGIVHSIAGKGYYVRSVNIDIKQKILLLFDEFNSFKEDLYNSFLTNLKENIEVDIYFHHFNPDVFNSVIYNNIGSYNYYIIMPANLKNTGVVIENLPEDKVLILDQTHEDLSKYPCICQNFEKDIYDGLYQALDLLRKYNKLIFVFSELKQPKYMLMGFNKFCEKYEIKYEIISNLESRQVSPGEVYLIPDDKNLILVIKKMQEKNLVMAKDIGIISINDTLLKEIVQGGITTISTDFKKMGEILAKMVTDKENVKIENTSKFILRKSL